MNVSSRVFPPRKLKIAFAINDLKVGGAQIMVTDQFRAIDRNRFDPTLITIYRETGLSLREKYAFAPGEHVEFLFSSIRDIRSWFRVYQFLKKERFDIVITNLFDTNCVVRSAAIAARVPRILTYEHNIYYAKRLWQRIVDRILAKFTYRILVGAPQVKTFTLQQEKLPEAQVEVVYDATELTFEDVKRNRAAVLKKYGLPEDRLYIVACGRLIPQKGHPYLIEAMRLVLERRKHLAGDIQLLLFGEGILRNELLHLIEEKNLQDHIRMFGMTSVSDILAISDIFSLISAWEGFSIALIQAMNAGCAIVASRVSGSVDAIVDGVDGLLIPPLDSVAAATAYLKLIEDEPLRIKLGASAKKKSRLFDVKNQIKQIENIVSYDFPR